MAKVWLQARGPDPVQRRNSSKKTLQTLRPVVGRTNPTLGRISLWPMVGGIDPTPERIPFWPIVRGTDPTLRMSLTSVDIGGGVDQEKCILILQRMGVRPKAARTRQTNVPIAVGVQQTEDRPMATCTRYLGDDLEWGLYTPLKEK